jgi:hypothetical protein
MWSSSLWRSVLSYCCFASWSKPALSKCGDGLASLLLSGVFALNTYTILIINNGWRKQRDKACNFLKLPNTRPSAPGVTKSVTFAGFLWVEKIGQLRPQLITFNGHSFDLPVLRYRAMVNRVPAAGLQVRQYFHRQRDRGGASPNC